MQLNKNIHESHLTLKSKEIGNTNFLNNNFCFFMYLLNYIYLYDTFTTYFPQDSNYYNASGVL